MNGPFSRSYFTQQPSRPARTVPGHQKQPQKASPKVISVPVHFVSSDQPKMTSLMLKESSAFKIQKTFRGFLVRKIVKKIASIRNEVVEIERKINNDVEFLDLIRNNAKERLRVNETLMSLLFKLDSIHGVDFGVRVLRKSVTNKAITLQEKVDSIGQQTLDSPNDTSISEIDDNCNTEQGTENMNDSSIGEIDDEIVKEVDENCVNGVGDVREEEGLIGEMENREVVKKLIHQTLDSSNDTSISEIDNNCNTEQVTENINDSSIGEIDDEIDNELVKEVDENCVNCFGDVKEEEEEEEGMIGEMENREVVKKLMDDNEKMMKLMAKISETNEMQTRMINSLSGRVEQLEKAFIFDRMMRLKKKKKRTHVCDLQKQTL